MRVGADMDDALVGPIVDSLFLVNPARRLDASDVCQRQAR